MMIVFDKKQGVARDVGEFWSRNATDGKDVIVDMSLNDEEGNFIDFHFNGNNLVVPVDRLKKLLRPEIVYLYTPASN